MGEGGSGQVDFTFLQGYAAGDETFVREVLTLFAAEAEEWGRALAPAGDWQGAAHTLKGASRTIGAAALGDLCERAEAEGVDVLPQVRAALDAVLREIGDYLAR